MRKFDLVFNLSVTFLREKKRYIAYAPALDLSTSGKSYKEAKKRFEEASVLFFEELVRTNRLAEVLEDLGWEKTKREWRPPVVIAQNAETVRIPVPS